VDRAPQRGRHYNRDRRGSKKNLREPYHFSPRFPHYQARRTAPGVNGEAEKSAADPKTGRLQLPGSPTCGGKVELSHTYTAIGLHTVHLTWRDDLGSSIGPARTDDLTVNVIP
jgi:hypothetical protein